MNNGEPAPRSSLEPTDRGSVADQLRIQREASVDTGSSYVGSLAFAEDTAVFGFAGDDVHDYSDSIGVWETRNDEIKKVAVTEFVGGMVSGVAFDGESIVFVDIGRQASTDSGERLAWKIRHVAIDGSIDEVLATSPHNGSVTAPIVRSGAGRFAWTTWEDQADAFAGRRVYEWRAGSGAPQVVARGIWLNDSVIPVADGLVYTETKRNQRWPSGMYKTDVYLRRTDVAQPVNLSSSGLVLDYFANGDGVAWTEAHPSTKTDGMRSDPYNTYYRPLTGSGEATRLASGYSAGNLAGGSGWVSWWSSRLDVEVTKAVSATSVRLKTDHTFVPTRPAGDGDSLVFGESSSTGVTLTLASVSL